MASISHGSVLRPTLVGLAVGATYGVALRAWMRLISTEPGFTWTGSGYIVGIFAVVGLLAGLCSAGRRRHWGPSLVALRTGAIILSLGCFVAAGSAMFPTIVPAALGRARSDWPRWLRAALLAVGVATAVWISLAVTLTDLGSGRLALGLLLYLGLCCVEVEIVSRLYAPSLRPGTLRYRSRTTSPSGREQQIRTSSAPGLSNGSGA
jgi:hypothetical protein